MLAIWSNMDPGTKQILLIFGGIMIVYIIGYTIFLKKKKGDINKWLENNPGAVKVFLETKSNLVKNNTIQILSVDGKDPVLFYEATKVGFYLLPGTHVVESVFSSTRPGVLHRNVTTTYSPVKNELTVERDKTYTYTFDAKEQTYEFLEN